MTSHAAEAVGSRTLERPAGRPWGAPRVLRLAMTQVVAALAVAVGLVALASDASAPGEVPAEHTANPVAARAVAVHTGTHPPSSVAAALPVDFDAVMGYAPTPVRLPDGTRRAGKPTGACSAPGGGRPFGFGPACQAHDLGYDLLRYAAATGSPLGADARRRLDAMLARDLYASCRTRGADTPGCRLLADAYIMGAQFNSWRQRYGPPVPEPYLPWAIGLGVLVVLAVPVARQAPRLPWARLAPWARLTRATGPVTRAAAAAANTPDTRDRYVDFLRAASLLVVVLGHWLMIYVVRSGDALTGGNILAVMPGLWPLTWVFQVMPVFFFVGGFANLVSWQAGRRRVAAAPAPLRHAYVAYVAARAARLLRPVLVFGCVWLVLAIPLSLLEMPDGRMATIGTLLLQPLWFVAVYLAVVALAPAMAGLHRRFRLWVPAALAAGVVVVDVLRLRYGLGAVGYLNFLLVWTLVHQLGFYYADGSLVRLSRRALVLLGGTGLAALAVLTGSGAYSPSMVGLPGEPSNMSPPTLAIVALTAAQVAVIVLVRKRVRGWLARRRPWTAVILTGSMTMTIYLWHQTAMLALLGVVVALDAPLPGPAGSALWWVSRPLWLALLLLILGPLVFGLSRFERGRLVRRRGAGQGDTSPDDGVGERHACRRYGRERQRGYRRVAPLE